jgi:hypothetical protein
MNAELFYQTVKDAGLKLGYIDQKMGITRTTMLKKLSGANPFNADEIMAFQQATRCNDSLITSIFLS